MADEPTRSGSWWATVPGLLTASAAVITAASGLFAILAQNGVLGEGSKNLVSDKATAVRDAVTPTGQAIEMQRMRRFDLSDWKNHSGKARITLNNGEVIDMRIDAYSMVGSNDLGDFSSDFAKIRSVEFVR